MKYFLTKYLTIACNVGQKCEKFTILRCFEKYAIFKTIYLKIEQGILIFHITVEQILVILSKRVEMFWNWHLRSCQFGAEICEN